jgi:biopolymer transport protein ExbD
MWASTRCEVATLAFLKGSQKRLILPPGYHLHPEHDLHGLRERLHGDGHNEPHFDLPLTSMIDMFSLLAIFLLMQFSSSNEIFFIPSKDLSMPNALHGRSLDSAPLVSILSDNSVRLDAEKVGDGPLSILDRDQEYKELRARLQQIRAIEETSHPGLPFKGQINIQADQATNLGLVKRVMNVMVAEGWSGINFVVRPSGAHDGPKPASVK